MLLDPYIQKAKMSHSPRESSKHHFVPRSLLRYFRPPGEGEYLYAFDKHSGKEFRTSLMNAGSEHGYNTLVHADKKINFESDFDRLDGLLAARLRGIHETRSLASLSAQQRADWAELLAVQLLRTPIVRSTVKNLADELTQISVKFGVDLGSELPSENGARKSAHALLQNRDKAIQSLLAKDFVLFETSGEIPFRISDRPVTLQSSLPFGDTGLSSFGVAIFMPLGQGLMLGMLCPSIRKKLSLVSFDRLDLPADRVEQLVALKNGLTRGELVTLNQNMVERHNQQQIAGCSRFVYGPTQDFEDVRTLILAHPETRDARSFITMGKMGEGPAEKPNMPPGSWLALFGRTESHMLEVSDVSEGEPFEMTVQDKDLLAHAMSDGPFSEVQLYDDRRCCRGMRNVCLVVLQDSDKARVQVRFADPALDALMKTIG